MSRRMRKYKKELCFLGTCKKSQRKSFVSKASSEVLKALGDAIKTLLTGNLPISNHYRKKLRKDVSKLKFLSSSRGGIVKKKKFLQSQRGGSLLGTIWNVIKNLF